MKKITIFISILLFYFLLFPFEVSNAYYIKQKKINIEYKLSHSNNILCDELYSGEWAEEDLKNMLTLLLKKYNIFSENKVDLLYGISCIESNKGKYLKQYPQGPARSIYQIEKETHDLIYKWFGIYKNKYKKEHILYKILKCVEWKNVDLYYQLTYNLEYQTIIALSILEFRKVNIDKIDTIEKQAKIWKQFWNTYKGKGKETDYIKKLRG